MPYLGARSRGSNDLFSNAVTTFAQPAPHVTVVARFYRRIVGSLLLRYPASLSDGNTKYYLLFQIYFDVGQDNATCHSSSIYTNYPCLTDELITDRDPTDRGNPTPLNYFSVPRTEQIVT